MNNSDRGPEDENTLVQLLKLLIEMPPEKRLALLNQLEESVLDEDSTMNRQDHRSSYNKPVYFDFKNYTYTGNIKDISTTGMFIETEEFFTIGQMIMVNIPDRNNESQIRMAAEIVRTESEGIGVKFISKTKR